MSLVFSFYSSVYLPSWIGGAEPGFGWDFVVIATCYLETLQQLDLASYSI